MTLFVFSCTPGGDIFDDDKESSDTGVENNGTSSGDDKGNIHKGHEWVDLGLPSGIKWATCNVGATKPEEYGGYYAWGETEEKSDYSWETNKYANYEEGKFHYTKYGSKDHYKTTLDVIDDVACVKWGGSWRMPTKEELIELREKCSWKWVYYRGVYGMRVVGANDSIFLPAAGYRDGDKLEREGTYAYYASSTPKPIYEMAWFLHYRWGVWDDRQVSVSVCSRGLGFSVRPVCE